MWSVLFCIGVVSFGRVGETYCAGERGRGRGLMGSVGAVCGSVGLGGGLVQGRNAQRRRSSVPLGSAGVRQRIVWSGGSGVAACHVMPGLSAVAQRSVRLRCGVVWSGDGWAK